MSAPTLTAAETVEVRHLDPCDITYPTSGPCPQHASFEVLVNCSERARTVRRLLCSYHLTQIHRTNCLTHDRRHRVTVVAVYPL